MMQYKNLNSKMSAGDELLLLAIVFFKMQIELIQIELLDKGGKPLNKKRYSLDDHAVVDLYVMIGERVRGHGVTKLLKRIDEVLLSVVNEDRNVNNFLFASLLVELWAQDTKGVLSSRILLKTKVVTDYYHGLMKSDEEKRLFRTSMRVADNIYRMLTGRPQLTDQERIRRFSLSAK